jgi:hypothetical protein
MPVFALPDAMGLLVASREQFDPFEYVLRVVPAEEDLGLTTTSLEELVADFARLPFEWLIYQLARIARALYSRKTAEDQLAYACDVFENAPVVDRMREFLQAHDKALLFSEQQIFILLRLAIEHAAPSEMSVDVGEPEILRLKRCLLAAASVALEPLSDLSGGEPKRDRAVAALVQSGGYFASGDLLSGFARGDAILMQDPVVAGVEAGDRNPLGQWLAEDHYGLDLRDQFATGFAVAAITACLEDEPQLDRLVVRLESLQIGSAPLGFNAERALAALSDTREGFIQRFKSRDWLRDGVYWDRTPVFDRPLLRRTDGTFLLMHPKALVHWLSASGVKRRITAAARIRGRAQNASARRQWGRLLEAYAVALARQVLPPVGGRERVAGDRPYRTPRGESRTPDLCIDEGRDLIVIAIVSGDLTEASRVDADPDQVQLEIERLVFSKINQLDAQLEALLQGRWAPFDGTIHSHWHRIWPVLITSGDLLQHELLWDDIERATASKLKQRRVQPLQLLDIEDFEALLGLVEDGSTIAEILRKKIDSPFRRLELAAWLSDAPRAPTRHRLNAMEEHMSAVFEDVVGRLGFEITDDVRARFQNFG